MYPIHYILHTIYDIAKSKEQIAKSREHLFGFALKVLVFLSKYLFFCNPPLGRALVLPGRGECPWDVFDV